jgi:hypothetical protein
MAPASRGLPLPVSPFLRLAAKLEPAMCGHSLAICARTSSLIQADEFARFVHRHPDRPIRARRRDQDRRHGAGFAAPT